MSERTHSADAFGRPVKQGSRKLVPFLAGTAVAVLVAGVLLQVFRAEPAASQTRAADGPAGTGKARLDGQATAAAGAPMARVNGQIIGYDDLARQCVARHGTEVLDSLINRLIIEQECKNRGITISPAEVREEVINIAKKFNMPAETWYQMLSAERGVSPDQYNNDIIWPMLALKKLAGTSVQVTEQDIQRTFIRDYGPRVKARMILIDGNVRQASQVWELAQAAPRDFDRLAREHSADPNTRALGGVIPPIRRYGGNDKVEEVAFSLKEGEISAVTQVGENRYVILKCEGFTDPVVTDIKEVRDELQQQIVEERTQESVAKIFEDLKKQAQVDNYLTAQTTRGSPYANRSAPNDGAVRQAAGSPPGQVRPAGGQVVR